VQLSRPTGYEAQVPAVPFRVDGLGCLNEGHTNIPRFNQGVVAPLIAVAIATVLRTKLDTFGVRDSTIQADDDRLGSLVIRTAPGVVSIGDRGEVQSMHTRRAAVTRVHEVVGFASPAEREQRRE